MIKFRLLFYLILSIPTIVTAQKSNSIYVTAAGYFGVMGNINYERELIKNEQYVLNSNRIKISYGVWEEFFGDNGSQYGLLWTGLSGRSNNHIETGLGLYTFFHQSGFYYTNIDYQNGNISNKPKYKDYLNVYPAVILGYRFQKPQGLMVYRVGTGWPELFYLSLGVQF